MPPLNQRAWQDLTTWKERPPTHREAWVLLTDASLPGGFVNEVSTLQHATLRTLAAAAAGSLLGDAGGSMVSRAWNNRFANLVSGRFTELLFHHAYHAAIEAL